jgi:cytochrome P450
MPYLYRYMSDTSTEFAFGQSVNSQSKYIHANDSGNTTETKEDLDFVESTDFAQRYIVWRIRFGALYWLANSKAFQKACQTVKSYADGFVNRALSPSHKRQTKSDGLEKYVFLDELIKETRDPIELRDQVLQLLFAGRDTTSAALSWIILLLARHPTEFVALRETIISTFGTESSPLSPITFESLKGCKAITHVLYETMRLYPIVPINSRQARRDTTLPVGGGPDGKSPIVIKKGEHVGFSAYVIHRREDIWGSDAAEWKPERWVGRKLGWEFIGFGGGPRVCIGRKFTFYVSLPCW